MKLFASIHALFGLLTAMSFSLPAIAQQDGQRSGNFAQGRDAERMRQSPQRRYEKKTSGGNNEQQSLGDEASYPRIPEQKANQGQGHGQGQGREPLSPEERRQLRRDINAAGRDIYRRTGP